MKIWLWNCQIKNMHNVASLIRLRIITWSNYNKDYNSCSLLNLILSICCYIHFYHAIMNLFIEFIHFLIDLINNFKLSITPPPHKKEPFFILTHLSCIMYISTWYITCLYEVTFHTEYSSIMQIISILILISHIMT